MALVFRQERAFHPLDDLLRTREDVRIDVQADDRRREPQRVEQARVFVGLEHWLRAMPPVEPGSKRLHTGQVFRDPV